MGNRGEQAQAGNLSAQALKTGEASLWRLVQGKYREPYKPSRGSQYTSKIPLKGGSNTRQRETTTTQDKKGSGRNIKEKLGINPDPLKNRRGGRTKKRKKARNKQGPAQGNKKRGQYTPVHKHCET